MRHEIRSMSIDIACYRRPLWTVHAVAWDNDLQDLVALLSNRFLIFWRLRNREKASKMRSRACLTAIFEGKCHRFSSFSSKIAVKWLLGRSRELWSQGQFQQKKEFRFQATRQEAGDLGNSVFRAVSEQIRLSKSYSRWCRSCLKAGGSSWKVHLRTIDPKNVPWAGEIGRLRERRSLRNRRRWSELSRRRRWKSSWARRRRHGPFFAW